ncbi:MAG: Nif3-like dinuclear metal center hexameric protein [Bacteroidota bacterium]
MKVKDITNYLERLAPLAYQESYDNSGLMVGNYKDEVAGILLTLDITEEVLDEAISNGCNLIVAHHPLIFKGLKRITPDHWVERCVIKAIQNNINLYAAHTNLDNMSHGVNKKISERLQLQNPQILSPKTDTLFKLVTFVPHENKEEILKAMFEAGAGEVGNYDHCSYQLEGTGTFRPGEDANPHIGEVLEDETVNEIRLEVIIESHNVQKVIKALQLSHPYEEVAYYLTSLKNKNQNIGTGMIGDLESPMATSDFLLFLKEQMQVDMIRHTQITQENIERVAVCGGAGSFLLGKAIGAGADIFITGDFKYHDFFEAENKIIIADIGHYESEQFTKDLLYEVLSKKFTNIALRLSEVVTNPIKYL